MTAPIVRELRRWTLAAILATCGCIPDLALPPGAEVQCTNADDCPPGSRCLRGVCVAADANVPPGVALGNVARSLDVVTVPVVVTELEDESVTLTLELSAAGSSFTAEAQTFVDGQEVASVRPSLQGTAAELRWDARAHFGSDAYVFPISGQVLARDERAAVTETPVATFGFGNDPPVVTAFTADDPMHGITLLHPVIRDSAGDPVSVTALIYSRSGDADDPENLTFDLGDPALFPGGGLLGLATSAAGATHNLALDTRRFANYDALGTSLWITVNDAWAVSESKQSVALAVDNQSAPRPIDVTALGIDVAGGAGPIAIEYTVVDDEADPVDLRVELSLDAGLTWLPADEYRSPRSEGLRHLASAPGQGIRHTFFWDPTGVTFAPTSPVVRLTPTDGLNLSALSAAVPTTGAGIPPGEAPNEAPFSPQVRSVVSAVGEAPMSVVLADMNGDGTTDLVTPNDVSSNVTVLLGENDAELDFAPPLGHPVGGDPWALAVADFDGDNALDLAVTSLTSNTLTILRAQNGGDGTFNTAGTYQMPRDPWHVIAADLDDDGDVDLATANANGTVAVLLGDGDATFAAPTSYAVGQGANFLAANDLFEDGSLDLLVSASDGSYTILRGDGDGTFTFGGRAVIGAGLWGAAVADFDEDGILDAALVDFRADQLLVVRGQGSGGVGDGTFAAPDAYPVAGLPRSVAAADLDADGITDLAVVSWAEGAVNLLLGQGVAGNGDGSFADAVQVSAGVRPVWVTTGELDGDGNLDVIVCDSFASSLLFLPGDGNGGLGDLVEIPLHSAPAWIATGHFDAAQGLDIATANYDSGDVAVLSNQGGGAFRRTLSLPATHPASLAVIDLDEDGVDDLVVGEFDTGRITPWIGENVGGAPGGTFAPAASITTGPGLWEITAADVDGDGVLDVVSSSVFADQVWVSLISGGALAPATAYTVGEGPTGLLLSDIDSDGRLDILTANQADDSISWLAGETGGTFADAISFTTPATPVSLAVGDVDDDGLTDLVVGHFEPDLLTVWRGDGLGGFSPLSQIDARDDPYALLVSDANADGVNDILVTDARNTLDVALGQRRGGVATGGFSPAVSYGVGLNPVDLTTADVDGDGLADLLAVNRYSSDVSVLLANPTDRNIGGGTFASSIGAGIGLPIVRGGVGDLDADGVTDVVVATAIIPTLIAALGAGARGVPTGRFDVLQEIDIPSIASDFALADLDGDEHLDVALATTAGVVTMLGAAELGTFGPPTTTTLPAVTCLAPLRLDGAPGWHLVAAPTGAATVSLLLSEGDGTFSPTSLDVDAAVTGIAVCDIDGDGRDDVAVAQAGASQVQVLLGTAAASLTAAGSAATESPAVAILCRDLDADGWADLLALTPAGLEVHASTGDGALDVPRQITLVGEVRDAAIADINGDGGWDLIAATDGPLVAVLGSMLAGIPTGDFEPPVVLRSESPAVGLRAGDLDSDGIADVAIFDLAAFDLALGQLEDFRAAWVRPVRDLGDPLRAGARSIGTVFDDDPDRFGQTATPRYLNQHRERRLDIPCAPGTTPLTEAWYLGSDQRLTTVARGGTIRLRVEERFGPLVDPSSTSDFDRVGLDLSAAPARGLVVELPIPAGRALPAAGALRVSAGAQDWQRASEVPGDPISGDPDANRYLPQTADGNDIIIERVAWREVPLDADGDLTTGSGERAVVDPAKRSVRVALQRLGWVRACSE